MLDKETATRRGVAAYVSVLNHVYFVKIGIVKYNNELLAVEGGGKC